MCTDSAVHHEVLTTFSHRRWMHIHVHVCSFYHRPHLWNNNSPCYIVKISEHLQGLYYSKIASGTISNFSWGNMPLDSPTWQLHAQTPFQPIHVCNLHVPSQQPMYGPVHCKNNWERAVTSEVNFVRTYVHVCMYVYIYVINWPR